MRDSVPPAEVNGKGSAVDQDDAMRSTTVDRSLARLRQCASDLGWTLDALSAHMRKDKAHISRVFNGEKSLTLEFLIALPEELQARFAALYAEAFGLVVVTPATGPEALKQFTAGLFGLFAQQLPVRSGGQLKASLSTAARRRA